MNCSHQPPLSIGLSKQEYWSGLPFPSPGDLPDPGIKPRVSCIAGRFFTVWASREGQTYHYSYIFFILRCHFFSKYVERTCISRLLYLYMCYHETNGKLFFIMYAMGIISYYWLFASMVVQMVKCLPAIWETWFQSLGWEDPLEKEMATHSSALAWKIPQTEEPDRLQSTGLQRVGHDWLTSFSFTLLIFNSSSASYQYCILVFYLEFQEDTQMYQYFYPIF